MKKNKDTETCNIVQVIDADSAIVLNVCTCEKCDLPKLRHFAGLGVLLHYVDEKGFVAPYTNKDLE